MFLLIKSFDKIWVLIFSLIVFFLMELFDSLGAAISQRGRIALVLIYGRGRELN